MTSVHIQAEVEDLVSYDNPRRIVREPIHYCSQLHWDARAFAITEGFERVK